MNKKETLIYQVHHCDLVDSTNRWANDLAKEGAFEGTVCVANAQTAGRGRRGRSWVSPAGESIYMSMILRPKISPEKASMLTLVMGLSVVQACRQLYDVDAQIKWPNDMVIHGKKVCGILTEMNLDGAKIGHVIVGTGINVNQKLFENEIQNTATSLALELGREVDREELLDVVLKTFASNYEKFLEAEDMSQLLDAYNGVLVNKDKEIRVLDPTGEYNGVSGGINQRGELLVTKEDGTCECVYAGEVSVRGVYGYV